jgi:serine/threonine protein kinase
LDDQTWFELNYFSISDIDFTQKTLVKLLAQDLKNLGKLEKLGSGASGSVYRLSFCSKLAMKVFENRQFAEIALQHEATALAKLEGQGRVIEGGKVINLSLKQGSTYWLILYAHIEGESTLEYLWGKWSSDDPPKLLRPGKLTALYERRTQTPQGEAEKLEIFLKNVQSHLQLIHIMEDVVRALQGMHQANTIHRDIKPENMMTKEDTNTGETLTTLIDFGIACEEGYISEEFMGTPPYVPPEGFPQEGAHSISAKWDIYSAVKTLEQMIRGALPLENLGFIQIQVQHFFRNEGTENRIDRDTQEALKALETDLFPQGSAYYNGIKDILKEGTTPSLQDRLDSSRLLDYLKRAAYALKGYYKVAQKKKQENATLTVRSLLDLTHHLLLENSSLTLQKQIQVLKTLQNAQLLDLHEDHLKLKKAFEHTQDTLRQMQILRPLSSEKNFIKTSKNIQGKENEFFDEVARFSEDIWSMCDQKLKKSLRNALDQNTSKLFRLLFQELQDCKKELSQIQQRLVKAKEEGKIQTDPSTKKLLLLDRPLFFQLEQEKQNQYLAFIFAFQPLAKRYATQLPQWEIDTKRYAPQPSPWNEDLKLACQRLEKFLTQESWKKSPQGLLYFAPLQSLHPLLVQLSDSLQKKP